MSTENSKNLSCRWIDELNCRNLAVVDEIFAADCLIHMTGNHEPIRGAENFKRFMASLLAVFSHLHLTIDDQIIDDNRIATFCTARGRQTSARTNVLPTGQEMKVQGVVLDRIAGGKITERWEQYG